MKKIQCFTASYHGDSEWYRLSLMSMKKFCVGFLPPVVCVSKSDESMFQKIRDEVYPDAIVAVLDGDGVARAQVSMLSCDLFCPEADWIVLMGSDCIVGSEMRPEVYFQDGKPVMLYNSYAHLLRHHAGVAGWKTGTERILRMKVEFEYMRRVPTLYSPEIYRATRTHIEKIHKAPFGKFITDQQNKFKDVSEANILGAYAWEHFKDAYVFENMDNRYDELMAKYPNPSLQFWSRAGVDHPCDQHYKYVGGDTFGKTPRKVIKEILGQPDKPATSDDPIEIWDEEVTEQKLFPPKMVCALGVSHKDIDLAVGWLRWTSFLATLEEGTCHDYTLVIGGTQRLQPEDWKRLRAAIYPSVHMFKIEGMVLPDENEAGYPISASHLFLRTLEHCEQMHPGSPVLWVESDSVPMRPGWFSEIVAEYEVCGKPFMGYLEGVTTVKHMPGVAVYPPNWRTLSPLLANVLTAPDDKVWGKGKGRAFDIWASPETVPQMAVAKTIQQIWRPKPFTEQNIACILPETALFHQCKTGRLIEVLARTRYPDYLGNLVAIAPVPEAKPTKLFCIPGHLYKVMIGSEKFEVERRVQRYMAGFGSIIRPKTLREERVLIGAVAAGTLEEITEEILASEMRKLQPKKGQIRSV